MKIECLIRRKTGSTVVLNDTEYHFAPENHVPDAPQVCEVDNGAHIKILLENGSFREFGAPIEEPEFKPLTAPPVKKAEPVEKPEDDLSSMTKAKLVDYIKKNGLSITVEKGDSKNVILNKIWQVEHGNG